MENAKQFPQSNG